MSSFQVKHTSQQYKSKTSHNYEDKQIQIRSQFLSNTRSKQRHSGLSVGRKGLWGKSEANRLTKGLGSKRSFNIWVLFPKKKCSKLQIRYHHSPEANSKLSAPWCLWSSTPRPPPPPPWCSACTKILCRNNIVQQCSRNKRSHSYFFKSICKRK